MKLDDNKEFKMKSAFNKMKLLTFPNLARTNEEFQQELETAKRNIRLLFNYIARFEHIWTADKDNLIRQKAYYEKDAQEMLPLIKKEVVFLENFLNAGKDTKPEPFLVMTILLQYLQDMGTLPKDLLNAKDQQNAMEIVERDHLDKNLKYFVLFEVLDFLDDITRDLESKNVLESYTECYPFVLIVCDALFNAEERDTESTYNFLECVQSMSRRSMLKKVSVSTILFEDVKVYYY